MKVCREITVRRTPRFYQLCGKFDLPNGGTTVQEWDVDVTMPAEWSIGVIVGPSMAGKTTLARELFGAEAVPHFEPDWVIEVYPGRPVRLQAARGLVRRPDTHLDVRRCDRDAWGLFAPHHYLDRDLSRTAKCFVGFVGGQPACFTAVIYFPHASGGGWREHRTVCLPDFQGVGIGNAMSEFVASLFAATGRPYYSTTSHPAMIRHRARSPLWRMTRRPALGTRHTGTRKDVRMAAAGSTSRITAGFTYAGPTAEKAAAQLGVT